MKKSLTFILLLLFFLPLSAFSQNANKMANRKVKMMTVENGKKAPIGTFSDGSGKIYSFEDFRGKLIVVDFWASWCGPCIQQTPYFEELANKFNDDEVVFLKISIDQKRSFWEKFISERNWDKNSFWIGTDELNPIYPFVYTEYNDRAYKGIVTAVPRYVIISREGNILENQAFHPSHPRLQKDIKYYLKKK